jgi:hypothetical protein
MGCGSAKHRVVRRNGAKPPGRGKAQSRKLFLNGGSPIGPAIKINERYVKILQGFPLRSFCPSQPEVTPEEETKPPEGPRVPVCAAGPLSDAPLFEGGQQMARHADGVKEEDEHKTPSA